MSNNIDNLIFDNHDTYVYFSKSILESEHRVNLKSINNNNDIVYYSNYFTDIYTNGIMDGNFEVNRTTRIVSREPTTVVSFVGELTTRKGTILFNYAGSIVTNDNLYVIDQNFTTFATYKGGEYGKYRDVKISIDVSNNDYRVITVSY